MLDAGDGENRSAHMHDAGVTRIRFNTSQPPACVSSAAGWPNAPFRVSLIHTANVTLTE
jgi:hypothetical protein